MGKTKIAGIAELSVVVLIAVVVLPSAASFGQTIVVDVALDDYMDFGGAQTVAQLPGPDGMVTIREAVTAANNTPGPQTIAFAIPPSEWSFWYTDRAVIRLELMLYVSGDDTTIDFSTQVALTGDTNPTGNEVGLQYAGVPSYIPCLWLAGDRCTIKGLDVAFGNNFSQSIWISGNNNRVIGCTTNGLTIRGDYGGGDSNTVGGIGPGERNTFSEGVGVFSGASNNVIVGNIFRWGLRINGDTLYGTCDNNRIGGPTVAERNNLAGHGYFAEEGVPSGTQLEVQYANNTLIENNHVGTTPDGSAKFPGMSGAGGISIYTAAIGTIIRNNLVSGFEMTGINHVAGQRFGTAIGVGSTAAGTVMTGNRIGVAADGITPILNVDGLFAYSDPNGNPSNTRVGGISTGEGNVIANCERAGIRINESATGILIAGNSIFNNGGAGIDLLGMVPPGVTANDPNDTDTGGNGLQNFPVLESALTAGTTIQISGVLNTAASQQFALEFFSSPACDPSGFGEGKTFLGEASLVTDESGNATFAVSLPVNVAIGESISSTATDYQGNTSEFSACISVSLSAGLAGDIDGDGDLDSLDQQLFLAVLLGADSSVTHTHRADLNADGLANGNDLSDFVTLLMAP